MPKAGEVFALLREVRESLLVDQVLSTKQLGRLWPDYQVGPLGAGFHLHEMVINAPVRKGAPSDQEHVVYQVIRRRPKGISPLQMVHLMGTAEIRFKCGASIEDWESTAQLLGASLRPDAVWRSERGVFAVEYDTGHYKADTVARKVDAFRNAYDGIIWGCPIEKRCSRLQRKFPDVRVLQVEWH